MRCLNGWKVDAHLNLPDSSDIAIVFPAKP